MTKYMGVWPKGSREPGQPGDADGANLIEGPGRTRDGTRHLREVRLQRLRGVQAQPELLAQGRSRVGPPDLQDRAGRRGPGRLPPDQPGAGDHRAAAPRVRPPAGLPGDRGRDQAVLRPDDADHEPGQTADGRHELPVRGIQGHQPRGGGGAVQRHLRAARRVHLRRPGSGHALQLGGGQAGELRPRRRQGVPGQVEVSGPIRRARRRRRASGRWKCCEWSACPTRSASCAPIPTSSAAACASAP